MNITISRNGQQHGPYTLDQVKSYLASGQLQYSDLALSEGSMQWLPLSTVLGVAPPPPKPRSTGKLILMAIVWLLIFWIGSLMVVGFIAGATNPQDAERAGAAAGEAFGAILFFISIGLSVWLTIAGKLPGTKK